MAGWARAGRPRDGDPEAHRRDRRSHFARCASPANSGLSPRTRAFDQPTEMIVTVPDELREHSPPARRHAARPRCARVFAPTSPGCTSPPRPPSSRCAHWLAAWPSSTARITALPGETIAPQGDQEGDARAPSGLTRQCPRRRNEAVRSYTTSWDLTCKQRAYAWMEGFQRWATRPGSPSLAWLRFASGPPRRLTLPVCRDRDNTPASRRPNPFGARGAARRTTAGRPATTREPT